MDKQNRMPLLEALINYKNKGGTSFHIPAHSGGVGVTSLFAEAVGRDVLRCDATEIKGLDDYHKAEGVIAESQQLAAELWGSEEALFLINGTTSGIMAAICGVAGPGDEILIQRNSHKSVTRGCIISGAKPIYFNPMICYKAGLAGSVDPLIIKDILKTNCNVKAIYLTDPSYYGICSDLKQIIEIAHEAGIPVIVDEAHGAHLYFCHSGRQAAISAGADIVIQSIHKTVGSMTQSAIIHLSGDLIDKNKLKENIKMMQSTSPSYILMASLDAARYNMAMNGHQIFSERISWCNNIRDRLNAIKGIKCLSADPHDYDGVFSYDPLRLVISAEACGISGTGLADILSTEYDIDMEFADVKYVVGVVGPGTMQKDLDKLTDAISAISKGNVGFSKLNNAPAVAVEQMLMIPEIPEMVLTPRQAHFTASKRVLWEDCLGQIAAVEITPYPPGIPVVLKGERISPNTYAYINALIENSINIHGLEEDKGKWHSYILDTVQ